MDKGREGRDGTEQDRTNAGVNRNARRYGGQERPWVRFLSFLNFSTLLTFSFFFFPIGSFYAEYNDRRDGMGRD